MSDSQQRVAMFQGNTHGTLRSPNSTLAPLEKNPALTVDLIAHPNFLIFDWCTSLCYFDRAIENHVPSASWNLYILKIKRNDGSKIIVGVNVITTIFIEHQNLTQHYLI